MNLIYFIRLFFKNIWLIFIMAFLMAAVVFIFTRKQPETYTTSTTIYTGIATGYNIESGSNARFDMFANNAEFDNLINIIKSRETQEKTAIRLMAQHLLLSKPEPKYCLPKTWRDLMDEVPPEIKRMAELSYLQETVKKPVDTAFVETPVDSLPAIVDTLPLQKKDSVMQTRTSIEKVQKFHHKKTWYTIKSGDFPSAVAQKFGITLEELEKLNSPMPPFQGGQKLVVGSVSEPYWTDTVMTNEVPIITPVLTPVESSDTGAAKSPDYISGEVSTENLSAYERLVERMLEYKNADQENYLFQTLQSSNKFYGVEKIATVKVARIQSSDLLKLIYESNDPGVCMQTLNILTDVFRSEYHSITAKQTGLVSEYFRGRVALAKNQLDSLEMDLLAFRMKNRIINYDEQTKFISEQKELLDKDWYDEAGKFSAAKTALVLIEENLGEKGKSVLQNSSIMEKRKRVFHLASLISLEEIKVNIDMDALTRLKGDLERLKIDLNNELMKSFELGRTVQGLNIQDVLQKWLEKAIEVEETQARYNTLTERKSVFLKKYDEFAPLGSQLKKIEREINLAQQDYLNHLNNLNQSIMKQKNMEQSDIQIIDSPVYPIKPNASKRMIAVIAAFMAGFVLTASLIILLEFLDSSIKFPSRLEELSGIKLLGAYPKIPLNPDSSVNYPLISSRAIDQITQRISLEELKQKNRGDQPFLMFFISTRENEGKSYLASRVIEKLRASGSKVLFVKPRERNTPAEELRLFNRFDQPGEAWDYEYNIPDNFISVKNINELLRNYAFITKGYTYLIIELPALLIQEYPATMVETGNLSILTSQASRTWNNADTEAVKLYQSNISHPVFSILNGCHVDRLESIIGEIPKRRSFLRKLIKKVVNLNFKTQEIA